MLVHYLLVQAPAQAAPAPGPGPPLPMPPPAFALPDFGPGLAQFKAMPVDLLRDDSELPAQAAASSSTQPAVLPRPMWQPPGTGAASLQRSDGLAIGMSPLQSTPDPALSQPQPSASQPPMPFMVPPLPWEAAAAPIPCSLPQLPPNLGLLMPQCGAAALPLPGPPRAPEAPPAAHLSAEPGARARALCRVTDFSPNWDWVEGGTKVLIIMETGFVSRLGGSGLQGLRAHFGPVAVPLQVVKKDVFRCHAPPAPDGVAGAVQLLLTLNDQLVSQVSFYPWIRGGGGGGRLLGSGSASPTPALSGLRP